MKRPVGIVLISGLMVLFGIRMLGGSPVGNGGPWRLLASAGLVTLGVFAIAVASALWRRTEHASRIYWCWAAAYLLVGGLVQVGRGTSWPEVVIWCAVVGALLSAVGLHVRYALRQAA